MKRSSGAGSSRTQIGGRSTGGRLVPGAQASTGAPDTVPARAGLPQAPGDVGAAYQASSLVAGFLALFTLPLYTHHLTKAAARLRRDAAHGDHPRQHPAALRARRGVRALLVRRRRRRAPRSPGAPRRRPSCSSPRPSPRSWRSSSPGALSQVLLGTRDATLMAFGVLGLWAFTNLEMAYALLRVEERRRTYLIASVSNVRAHRGADGDARRRASTAARAATCWATTRRRPSCSSGCGSSRCATASGWTCARRARWARCCASGRPTVPGRRRGLRAQRRRPRLPAARRLAGRRGPVRRVGEARRRSSSSRCAASRPRGRRWPTRSPTTTRRAGSTRCVTTAYVHRHRARGGGPRRCSGAGSCGCSPPPAFYAAHEALPWVALGWALYGLFLVFVTIAGRAKVTTRTFPAAVVGLAVNVAGLVAARRAAGHRGRGHRAVRGLPGDARRRPPAHAAALRACRSTGRAWPRVVASSAGSRWRASCCCRRAASTASRCARSRCAAIPRRARRPSSLRLRRELVSGPALTACARSVGAARRPEGRAGAPASSWVKASAPDTQEPHDPSALASPRWRSPARSCSPPAAAPARPARRAPPTHDRHRHPARRARPRSSPPRRARWARSSSTPRAARCTSGTPTTAPRARAAAPARRRGRR